MEEASSGLADGDELGRVHLDADDLVDPLARGRARERRAAVEVEGGQLQRSRSLLGPLAPGRSSVSHLRPAVVRVVRLAVAAGAADRVVVAVRDRAERRRARER